MKNKIISIFVVTVMLFTLISTSLSASALVDSKIKYGDIDGSGVVDTSDARTALMVAAGLDTLSGNAYKKADVNTDGSITLFDARQILRSATGLVSLQPSGAFSGFKGSSDGAINIASPEAAMSVFNLCLNKVKTENPGFIRSETRDITDFNIKELSLVGINLGNSTESVSQMVKDMIVDESEPEQSQVIIKGDNTYNAMSVEGEDYVSKLTADEVYGVQVSQDKDGYVTIKVALPDGELDNLDHTAYAKAFNTSLIQEDANGVLIGAFENNSPEDARVKNVENAVLTLVIDTAGRVVSYTTTYEVDLYLAQTSFDVSSILSAELKGLSFRTKVTVTYNDFQW